MGKKHKKHKHVSKQKLEGCSEMRVVFHLPRTVQVGRARSPHHIARNTTTPIITPTTPTTSSITGLLVSIPLEALRPDSPSAASEGEGRHSDSSPAAERRSHKHKKHKRSKRHLEGSRHHEDNRHHESPRRHEGTRHHEGHRETADNRAVGSFPVGVDDAVTPPSPAPPLKFSYKIKPASSPPLSRLPPPSSSSSSSSPALARIPEGFPSRLPPPSPHSKSGKSRHPRPAEDGSNYSSSGAESPAGAGSLERVAVRSGKPTTLAGLASLRESEPPEKQKKRKHKHHHQDQGDTYPPGSGGESKPAATILSVTAKESSVESKKIKLEGPPVQPSPPPLPLVSPLECVGATKSAMEMKVVPRPPADLPSCAPKDPGKTRPLPATPSPLAFPSLHSTKPLSWPLTPTAALKDTPPAPPSPLPPPSSQVRLSADVLKSFLIELHQQISRRDPEGIFAEPVTDDIAPGYSAIISHPLDLKTIMKKIETNSYLSVNEFRDDFELMCNNAMTYNTPDTVYYASAKRLLTFGLKLIAKEAALRADIGAGVVQPSSGALPAPTIAAVDYSSPWLCRISLQAMSTGPQSSPSAVLPQVLLDQDEGVGMAEEQEEGPKSQPPLTTMQVGMPEEVEEEEGKKEEDEHTEVDWSEDEDDEGVGQVAEVVVCEVPREDGEETIELPDFCFLSCDGQGKTSMSILNPDTGNITSSKPLDFTLLSDRVKMGESASSLLQSELAMFKATPVSYLMFGPFGSFAPVFDSTFATLTKCDSNLLLSTYGNDTGVSYAHSLQQFVKDTGSFVSEMAQALLNGLTGGRHQRLVEAMEPKGGKEQVHSTRGDGNSIEDEASDLASAKSGSVVEQLHQTSKMITSLYQQQIERLGQPPVAAEEGSYGPQPPSEKELGTAQAVAMGLASLTAQLQPQDVVSLQAVRQAMGIAPCVPLPRHVKNFGIVE